MGGVRRLGGQLGADRVARLVEVAGHLEGQPAAGARPARPAPGSRSRWPGTHCSVALETRTSTGSAAAAQSRRSATSNVDAGVGRPRLRDHLGAGVEPDDRASGQRSASSAVRLPGPQPRSTTVRRVGGADPRDELDEGPAALVGVGQVALGVPGVHAPPCLDVRILAPRRHLYLDVKILDTGYTRAPCATTSTSSPRPGPASAPTSTSRRSRSSAGSRRLARHLDLARREAFAAHEIESWEFDVLAALRRAGAPYELSPGRLLRETLVTSGTMTNRVDRLAARGLVERYPDPDDRRGVIVRLTPEGKTHRRRRVRRSARRRARAARRPARAGPHQARRRCCAPCWRRSATRASREAGMDEQHYLIRGGIEGRERLRVLGRVMRPDHPAAARAGGRDGRDALPRRRLRRRRRDVRPRFARRDHRTRSSASTSTRPRSSWPEAMPSRLRSPTWSSGWPT